MKTMYILDGFKRFNYILIPEGIVIGLLSGLVVSLFRFMVESAEHLRTVAFESGHTVVLLLFLIGAYAVVCLCLKIDINCSGSGIPRVKGELEGRLQTKWYKALATMLAGSACSIGSGMSMGQVGPSVQLGAMAAKGFSRLSKIPEKYEKLFLTAGSGAGFSAVLNAPLAGLAFSAEEMNRQFSSEMLITTLTACLASDFVTSCIFGFEPLFAVSPEEALPADSWIFIIGFGIMTGILGAVYNRSIKALQACFKHIKSTLIRIAVPAAAAAVLFFICPDAAGGGNTLICDFMSTHWAVRSLLTLLVIRYIFTVICFSSGAPGGLIGPLLVIGAVTGALFAAIIGYGEYISNFILLGMAGYFTAVIRTPFTAVILMSETAGSLIHVPSISAVCLISYLTAGFLKTRPIFSQLLDNILKTDDSGKEDNAGKAGKE